MKFFNYLLTLPLALAVPVVQTRADKDKAALIPQKWIAVLNDDSVLDNVVSKLTTHLSGSKPEKSWEIGNFKAVAFGAEDNLIKTITESITDLAFIEQDSVVTTQAIETQDNPPYGLARISHREIDNSTYIYDSSAGEGIVAYGIDTGIYAEHEDFGGRATMAKSFVDGEETDGNGHGTHTAATMAGTKYGVAKKATVVGVKVLSDEGSGSTSQIISGIEWAVNDMKKRGKAKKAVANMSFGGLRTSNANNAAVKAAVDAGLFVAVAAGNSNLPAELYSPASEPSACTVAASDGKDQFASFSNFGPVVDVIAPGVDVKSAWIGGKDKTNTISGTSMATPHIAGLGAYYLALQGAKDPVALCDLIKTTSTKNKVQGLQTLLNITPNNLAFNGAKS